MRAHRHPHGATVPPSTSRRCPPARDASPSAEATDWREISLLYGELMRHEPTAVVEANRAIAVAMAEEPAAGLVILDTLIANPQLAQWSQLHVGRADLLAPLGRTAEAIAAYREAGELEPPAAERAFIGRRIRELTAAGAAADPRGARDNRSSPDRRTRHGD